ncbi:murein DD-endopeptidase MepM/ murein hydrolase activator NlpD [Janthinobacterium sp. CG_23.3]|uniref:M56 family metallopeptidase n=1 Tax=Janthinobacterium sp. CG_23.3 TaxID=3349634 RepID=UPI0038D5184F
MDMPLLTTLISLKLLYASLVSLLAGLLLWGALRLALRRWPALAAQRALWLLAQGVVGAVFVLALLPQKPRWSVVPPVTVTAATPLALMVGPAAAPAGAATRLDWRLGLPALWLPLYLAGMLWALRRVWRAQRLWRLMLAASVRLDGAQLRAHPAFAPAQVAELERRGLAVRQTAAAVSPMLAGLFKPCLLLPAHLDHFSVQQQQMIVEHELTHWRRRDPLWQALALLLQSVLWFNPALRWMGDKLGWAQELACDRQVLAGRPQGQRREYAAALVLQLKAQAGAAVAQPYGMPGLAFGGGGGMLERVRLMRQAGAGKLSAFGKWVPGLSLAAVLLAGAVLRPAFAWGETVPLAAAVLDAVAEVAEAPVELWRNPLDVVRVNSWYGHIGNVHRSAHKGIDFGAPKGTPVLAVAAGTVGEVARDSRYGIYIMLEHAHKRRSMYAHLDSTAVKVGETVAAGALIGKVGSTGMATGPHLHFEIFEEARRVNPQVKLTELDGKGAGRNKYPPPAR